MPNIGYKKCANNRIVELEPLGRNNEGRADIVDPKYAKMRCERARVLTIYDADTKEEFDEAVTTITYRKGTIVYPDSYDPDMNHISGNGIHYYKTFEPAYMHALKLTNYTGIYTIWYDNGKHFHTWEFVNGKCNDEKEYLYESYYDNGNTEEQAMYKHGRLNGLGRAWYKNGNIKIECNMKNDILDGFHKEWREDGTLELQTEYKDGNIISQYSPDECVNYIQPVVYTPQYYTPQYYIPQYYTPPYYYLQPYCF